MAPEPLEEPDLQLTPNGRCANFATFVRLFCRKRRRKYGINHRSPLRRGRRAGVCRVHGVAGHWCRRGQRAHDGDRRRYPRWRIGVPPSRVHVLAAVRHSGDDSAGRSGLHGFQTRDERPGHGDLILGGYRLFRFGGIHRHERRGPGQCPHCRRGHARVESRAAGGFLQRHRDGCHRCGYWTAGRNHSLHHFPKHQRGSWFRLRRQFHRTLRPRWWRDIHQSR